MKETYAEENITCPNCKKVATHDSWERQSDDGDEVCDYCEAEFSWTRDISMSPEEEIIKEFDEEYGSYILQVYPNKEEGLYKHITDFLRETYQCGIEEGKREALKIISEDDGLEFSDEYYMKLLGLK